MITHDRWQRIKEIFQSAQERTPTERLDFLDAVCGDDPLIREEVEALLTADASNDDFLDAPAYEFAAGMLADEADYVSEFSEGQKFGRYTILCPLGAGGMGQIYLAQDDQLGRKIALKLIAREFATEPRRVLRFEQEARAASALNHPNVCVIHEIGVTENGRHFIAMEHIQGITLRDKLTQEPFTPLEALHIARQVADALAAAHAARIVHRDIKPENIMLRPDGYVKVLDFGLAKLTEILPEQRESPVRSANVRTEAGTLMGTVKYMSPEQLHEDELDERTDIWSLGVVLYEMLTRTTPFDARTPNETIALILGSEPPTLTLSDELPDRFREIVTKALEKDRDSRYQTVTRLGSDLATLQRELERVTGAPHTPQSPIAWYPASIGEQRTQTAATGSAIFTRIKSQAIQTAEFIFSEMKSHKAASLFAGASVVLLLLLLVPTVIRKLVTRPANSIRMLPLTNSGTSICSAITPDGKLVAHAEFQDGKERLMLTSTITDDTAVIVPPEEAHYLGVAFSPDNAYLYFTRADKGSKGALYRLPIHGRAPVKIKEGVDSPVSFSPQGDRFAFVRLNETHSEYSLVVSDLTGTERTIASRRSGDTFSTYGLAWSPDGDTIVCPAASWTGGYHLDLIAFDLNGGATRVIGSQPWFSVYQVAWQDPNNLVMSAMERETSPHQLWRISYPEGAVEKITLDLDEYMGVSVAGDKIVTVRTSRLWRLWIASLDDPMQARSIYSGVGFTHGVSWTATGSIAFSSMVKDRLNISRINSDGSNLVQLTSLGDNYNPAASTDGRLIVFASNRNGGLFNIWSMNAGDGSDLKQLTFGDGNFYPSVSPDNQWITYDNQTNLKLSVWKVALQGGAAVKVAEGYRMPSFSPDNERIAARYDRESGSKDVAIFPAAGGDPLRKVSIPILEWQRPQWMNNYTLSYTKSVNGAANLWSLDLNTGAEKQLTFFNSDKIYAYAWSPDFKQIAFQRGTDASDVTIISSER